MCVFSSRLLILICLAGVSACSWLPINSSSNSSSESTVENVQSEQASPTTNSKLDRVHRQFDVEWMKLGYGGAVIRQPARIHVLNPQSDISQNKNQNSTLTTIESSRTLPSDLGQAVEQFNALSTKSKGDNDISPQRGYSLYEFSRWERYCNAGNGMDEYDWMFVDKEGKEHVPQPLLPKCQAPIYSYADYLSAWTRFCLEENLSAEDQHIVRLSVRPFSRVNPCKAIQ